MLDRIIGQTKSRLFFLHAFFLSSATTIQVEAIITEALLPELDTHLQHKQYLTETRDLTTTSKGTLVADCIIVVLNAEIKFLTPKGFEPWSQRKVNTTMPQLDPKNLGTMSIN